MLKKEQTSHTRNVWITMGNILICTPCISHYTRLTSTNKGQFKENHFFYFTGANLNLVIIKTRGASYDVTNPIQSFFKNTNN